MSVNGRPIELVLDARKLLVDVLREDLGLTGTHIGCEQGSCGACTVLVDGRPVRSCIMLGVQAEGCDVTTVEGITPEDGLNPMQQAFKDHHGLQCGFCTPGFLTTLAGVTPDAYPDEESVRELLSGNLCRCTGYEGILDAVLAAWGRDR
ncbi:MAG: (2Fe-2S)-binding protein [bacterium]|nr:(2Fe-2S)-binding protein [bacterium]MDE0601396.1 (2Fe-2S)-binding protein [bacterium]